MHKADVGTTRYNSFSWKARDRFVNVWESLFSGILTWNKVLWFCATFLIARSSLLMGEIAPFGFIFWAMALRFFPDKKILLTTASLIGWVTAPAGIFPPWFFPASMILWKGIDSAYSRFFRDTAPFIFLPFVLLMLRIPFLYVHGFIFYDTVIVLVEAVLAALFPFMLLPFFREINLSSNSTRPSAEVIIGAALILFLVFLGMSNSVWGAISPVNIVPPLLVLFGAYTWGPLWGAAAGIILGLTLSFADPSLFPYAGALGVIGMAAGGLREYNRVFTAAGYLIALRFLAFFASEGGYSLTTLQEDVITAVIFLVLPSSLWGKLQEWSFFLPFKVEGEEKLRFAMASRVKEFASVFKELAATFRPLEEDEAVRSKKDLSPLMDYFSRRVCSSCKHFDRCWRDDFYNQYRRVVSMLFYVDEKNTFSEKMIPTKLRRYCPRQREIVKTVGNMKEIYHLNCYWEEKIKEGRLLVSHQLEGMSSVMHDLAQELKLETAEEPQVEQVVPHRFTVEVGIAQVAKQGYSITGDSYTIQELPNNGQAIVLSDGMGSGREARNASQSTVKLMEHLLKTGLRQDVTINTINTLLRLQYPSERFTTLDLALLNLHSGEIQIHKLGAPPSYLKNGSEVKVIGSGSLPMGIFEDVVPEKEYITVSEGCTLIMITDGLLEVPDREEEDVDWIVQALKEIRHEHPQIIADRLIEEACYRWPRGAQDDLTVLVGSFKPLA